MSITQETAILIDTLAHAASQIGSTEASKRLNQVIVGLLPNENADSVIEALRQDNISLQTSSLIMAENLEVLRGRMEQINQLINQEMISIDDMNLLKSLSSPIDAPVEA